MVGPNTTQKMHLVAKNSQGFVFVYFALLLPVILGLGSFTVDVGRAYYMQQKAQVAADAAAFAGRIALLRGENITSAALAVASANGFVGNGSNLTVSVNCYSQCSNTIASPPALGRYATDPAAVQVIITLTQNTTLAKILGQSTLTYSASAVASGQYSATYCILGLGTGANADSTTQCSDGNGVCGNGNVAFGSQGTNCGIASNSAEPVANGGNCKGGTGSMDFRGVSGIVWGSSYACGGARADLSIFQSGLVQNGGQPVEDPYVSNGQKAWLTGLATKAVSIPAGATAALPTFLSSMTGNIQPSDPCNISTNFPVSCSCGKKCTPPIITKTSDFSTSTTCYSDMSGGTPSVSNSSCPASVYTISGTMSGSSTNITASGKTVFAINSLIANQLNGSNGGTFDIGTANSPGAGTFVGGTYFIDSVTGATTGAFENGTFYINNLDATSLSVFNASANCTHITYAPNTVNSGTLNGCGTYSIGTVSGTTILDGSNGGLFLINNVNGGTLRNGIFYANSVGAVTTNNATLVVFGSSISPSSSTFYGPTSNINPPNPSAAYSFDSAPKDSGFALVSPTAGFSFSVAGNSTFQSKGAIYFPGNGSSFHLQGSSSIDWSCGQLIAGTVELGGSPNMNVYAQGETNYCGTSTISHSSGTKLVQ